MSQSELESQLSNEIERLRALAIRSTDPLIVAKAVAVSDMDVRGLLLRRLYEGQRLVEVVAFHTRWSRTEVHVFFRFVSPEHNIRVIDSGVLAIVDSTRGEVAGTVDPYDLQPEQTPTARPFVLISPPDPSEFMARDDDYSALVERQKAFLTKMKVPFFGGTVYSVDPTIFGTETWSNVGEKRQPDDTKSDRTCDYNDCLPDTVWA